MNPTCLMGALKFKLNEPTLCMSKNRKNAPTQRDRQERLT
jgi:hypothetical protein